MATKKELLDEFTEAGLRELAAKHNVELQGESEEEIREEMANSAVTKAEIETYSAKVDRQEGTSQSTETLDPELTDPEEIAVARVEGRTSDAASRVEGTTPEDVKPDLTVGAKPTDTGEDEYPFPPAGDVEILTADSGEQEGEVLAPLEVEDWVILGEHELVPDRLVGRRAMVIDAPRGHTPVDKQDDTWVTVRTRDEVNATLVLPIGSFQEIQKGGLATTHRG